MKPQDGMYQTATQVKVLSHEIFNIEEADSFHLLEGYIGNDDRARHCMLLRGLSPWYGIERLLSEHGMSKLLSANRISGDNSKRKEFRDGNLEVGLTHSRGVVGVISYAIKSHSKGLATICKGDGIHSPATEQEKLCKRN